jgi:hypothetical protein
MGLFCDEKLDKFFMKVKSEFNTKPFLYLLSLNILVELVLNETCIYFYQLYSQGLILNLVLKHELYLAHIYHI